jgi:hypothetical protein
MVDIATGHRLYVASPTAIAWRALGRLFVRHNYRVRVNAGTYNCRYIGGTTTWFGPIVGAVVFTAIRQGLIGQAQPEVTQIVIAALLILMVLLRPQGVGVLLQRGLPRRLPKLRLPARGAAVGGGSR